MPYIGPRRTIAQNILIAADGSREAARAVADSMPLLRRAKHIDVLLGERPGSVAEFDERRKCMEAWLADHGLTCSIRQHEVQSISAGESLLSRAADFASDLLVMGGYGHTRVREFMLGGATRTILESMTLPVLMSH